MNAVAYHETRRASRYLVTLCQHFGRKVDVHHTDTAGWVQFSFGRCDLSANDTRLEMRVSAEDSTHLDHMVHLITNHLERYAFRENPKLDWQVHGS